MFRVFNVHFDIKVILNTLFLTFKNGFLHAIHDLNSIYKPLKKKILDVTMKIKEVIKKFLKMDAYCGFLNLMSIQYAFNVNVMFVLSQSSQRSPC